MLIQLELATVETNSGTSRFLLFLCLLLCLINRFVHSMHFCSFRMGTVENAVQSHITHGKTIACRVKAEALIAAGVSNWGGWGLLGAAWLQNFAKESAEKSHSLCPLLPSLSQEQSLLMAQANAGARDGTTGQIGDSVDGLHREIHEHVLQSIHFLSMNQEEK